MEHNMKKFDFDENIYETVANQVQVFDDCFDDRFIYEIDEMTDRLPLVLTNIANRSTYPYGNKGSHKLIGANLFERKDEYNVVNKCPKELLNLYIHAVNKVIPNGDGGNGVNVELTGISVNVQPMGQDGTPHRDGQFNSRDRTLMYFANSKWESKWGGPFQIIDPDTKEVINEIDFVPGRLIYFDAGLLHRGLAPKNVPYIYRKSVVYRIKTR
jgi:hypothetical protein